MPSFFSSFPNISDLLNDPGFASLTSEIFSAAHPIAGVCVFIDKSLPPDRPSPAAPLSRGPPLPRPPSPAAPLSRQLTRDTATGAVSLAEAHDNAVKFHSADRGGPKLIRVLYTGTDDDLYAVCLAF